MRDSRAIVTTTTGPSVFALVAFLSLLNAVLAAAASLPSIQFQRRGYFKTHVHPFDGHDGETTVSIRSLGRRQLEIRGSPPPDSEDPNIDDDTVHQLLHNEGILYLANVSIGTPPQLMELQIDTASSDIWVMSKEIPACQEIDSIDPHQDGCSHGFFDPGKSDTYILLGEDRFHIEYVDGSAAFGDYGEDTFSVGGATVEGMQIGVAKMSNLSYGIMGVGFELDQASVIPGGMGRYPNLVNEMVSQGLIRSKAFSLWLDDLESDNGIILFGGIDTTRFIGNLTAIPLQQSPDQVEPRSFSIPLTSITLANGQSHYNITSRFLPTTVLLDSGTSLTYLPPPIAASIAEKFNAKVAHPLGLYIVDCNFPTDGAYIEYTFSFMVTIRVPMSELILPLTKYSKDAATDAEGGKVCGLGVAPSKNDAILFGDTFLRSVYVVFDLDNERVAMAQTEFDPVGENIIEIGTGEDSIPRVDGVAITIMATGTSDEIPETGSPLPSMGSMNELQWWRYPLMILAIAFGSAF